MSCRILALCTAGFLLIAAPAFAESNGETPIRDCRRSEEGYACLQAARQISIRIARTMHVVRGAPPAKPPFAPPSR
jgi:hypothetical protein